MAIKQGKIPALILSLIFQADIIRPDFIRYLQMYRWADRLVLHQMADMHTLRLLTVFPHQQARM